MARYEEEVLQLENVELPINTDEEMVEEVEKENIEVPIIGDEERIDELVDQEMLNNNSARDEEDILQLQNDELPGRGLKRLQGLILQWLKENRKYVCCSQRSLRSCC